MEAPLSAEANELRLVGCWPLTRVSQLGMYVNKSIMFSNMIIGCNLFSGERFLIGEPLLMMEILVVCNDDAVGVVVLVAAIRELVSY